MRQGSTKITGHTTASGAGRYGAHRARWSVVGAVGMVAAVVTVTGCSGEDIAERIAEDAIERESGGDVDVDLDGGNVRVQTEDGSFEMSTDEDGNVSIRSEGADGEVNMNSEDGVTVIETEDGTSVISSGDGAVPEGFPEDIVLPDGLQIALSQSTDLGDGQQGWLLAGDAPGDWQAYADELVASLDAAGYTQIQQTTTPDGMMLSYERGELSVFATVGAGSEAGTTTISIQAGT